MSTALRFDKLNQLTASNRKSIPYSKYFGEMVLTAEQRLQRISFAEEVEETMLFVFSLIEEMLVTDSMDEGYIESELRTMFEGIVASYIAIDAQTSRYISEFARNTLRTTLDHLDEEFYLSNDRAILIAENEANSVINHGEYMDAISSGATHKTWLDFGDQRVRMTHKEINGTTIPIDEPFVVGEGLMMFPKDTSLGAPTEEIANCRCSVTYQ